MLRGVITDGCCGPSAPAGKIDHWCSGVWRQGSGGSLGERWSRRVGGLRFSFLFFFLVLAAFGFGRYLVLAHRDSDRELAIAAAVACFLMLLAAVLELFGVVW
jgi:hypothetical protein